LTGTAKREQWATAAAAVGGAQLRDACGDFQLIYVQSVLLKGATLTQGLERPKRLDDHGTALAIVMRTLPHVPAVQVRAQ